MSRMSAVQPDSPPHSPPKPWWAHLRKQLPASLAVLAFGALSFWGFRTEWKFNNPFAARTQESEIKAEGPDSDVVLPPKESVNETCPLDRTRLRLKSAEIASRIGLETAAVQRQPLRATVTAPAELSYDETRLARLSSRLSGTVVRVEKEVGNPVRAGEVIALIDAAEVGKSKAEFLQAIAQLELKQQTAKSLEAAGAAVANQKILEAVAAVRDARVRLQATRQALVNFGMPIDIEEIQKLPAAKQDEVLRLAGLPKEYAKSLDAETVSSNLIPVVAPFDGVVVERRVVVGEVVDSTKTLFEVGDLNRIWVVADIRTEDADLVTVGQTMAFGSEGHKGETTVGKVSWTSTAVDPRTRTLRVRAVVENPKAHWRAGTFGTAKVSLRDDQSPVLAVPAESLQRDGDCWYVFVRLDDTAFEMRAVRLGVRGQVGARKAEWVEIRGGLQAGERVVTTSAFALKSEVLKDRLGGD